MLMYRDKYNIKQSMPYHIFYLDNKGNIRMTYFTHNDRDYRLLAKPLGKNFNKSNASAWTCVRSINALCQKMDKIRTKYYPPRYDTLTNEQVLSIIQSPIVVVTNYLEWYEYTDIQHYEEMCDVLLSTIKQLSDPKYKDVYDIIHSMR